MTCGHLANVTHTIGLRANRPAPWSQFRTIWFETGMPVAKRRCFWRKLPFLFRCLRATSVKHLHWALLHTYDPALVFDLHLQSPVSCSESCPSLNSSGFCYFGFYPLSGQLLFKLLIRLNDFFWDIALIETKHLPNVDRRFPALSFSTFKAKFPLLPLKRRSWRLTQNLHTPKIKKKNRFAILYKD